MANEVKDMFPCENCGKYDLANKTAHRQEALKKACWICTRTLKYQIAERLHQIIKEYQNIISQLHKKIAELEAKIAKFEKTENEVKNADLAVNKAKSAPKDMNGRKPFLFGKKEIEKILDLHQKNTSNRKIAKIMGCNEKTIRNYLEYQRQQAAEN